MSNPSSFTVTVDGAGVGVAVASTVHSVGMLNDQVPLTLATAFDAGAIVAVTYTDVTGDVTPAIQDLAGNDATSLPW